jgi:hypothetical protein
VNPERTQFRLSWPGGAGRMLLLAAAVGAVAFFLYEATLLPGQDLGDTASFQATIGERFLTPRQGYPLYYAVGDLFVWLSPGNPARALNLASAVSAAIACGLLAWIVAGLSGSLAAGAFSGLLLASSYTFWSQAIIAEVYALHALVLALCLIALLLWAERPALARLGLFFLLYAAGYGNHLSMVLLLPGFTLLVLWAAPAGPLSMLKPRVLVLAVAMAVVGASQYLWNLWYLWVDPERTPGLVNLLATFWFDVTKADWRASMVLGTYPGTNAIRFAMYWFDLRQQFGVPGIVLAVAGAVALVWRRPAIGVSLLLLYLVNWGFAFTYNVGDRHVFYLPSHFVVALLAGLGVAECATLLARVAPLVHRDRLRVRLAVAPVVASLLLLYPAWRAVDTLPALDRSHDDEASTFYAGLTAGLTGENGLLGAELNWQLQNGLDYYAKHGRPGLVHFAANETVLRFPFLVWDNWDIGRDMTLTVEALPPVRAAYDGLFSVEHDTRVQVPSLLARMSDLPAGTSYVLTALAPYDDIPLDRDDLRRTVRWLTGGSEPDTHSQLFNVIAGQVGAPPQLVRGDDRPFRVTARQDGVHVDIRMEAWLPADTIRRMGFGAVILNRRHALTIDRGVSVVAFGRDGRVLRHGYLSALFAPQPRYIVRRVAGNR